MGKHCIYNKQVGAAYYSLLSRLRRLFRPRARWPNPWICQSCSPEDGKTCKPLERLGRCRPFPKYLDSGNVNEVHRVYTKFSPYSTDKSSALVYNFPDWSEGKGGVQFSKQYPKCSASLSLPCFDLSRCTNLMNDKSPLRIYSHGQIDTYINYTMTQQPNLIEVVDNPNDACLFVVGAESFDNPHEMTNHPYWNYGQNHFIYDIRPYLFGAHSDRPFNTIGNYGLASVARSAFDDAYIREGYDIPVALEPKLDFTTISDFLGSDQPRKYLLSFKGSIYPWNQRSWQHRWIAAEYWHGEDDVYVDTTCENMKGIVEEYKHNNYTELLLGSTFFFCPDGGGLHSFRFAESLFAGAIPVVTSDFVPPFHPEIDWSGCIVKVSDVRVVDVPRIVRSIPPEDVKERQRACARLAKATFGNKDNPSEARSHLFFTAMRIWKIRIENAVKQRIELNKLI